MLRIAFLLIIITALFPFCSSYSRSSLEKSYDGYWFFGDPETGGYYQFHFIFRQKTPDIFDISVAGASWISVPLDEDSLVLDISEHGAQSKVVYRFTLKNKQVTVRMTSEKDSVIYKGERLIFEDDQDPLLGKFCFIGEEDSSLQYSIYTVAKTESWYLLFYNEFIQGISTNIIDEQVEFILFRMAPATLYHSDGIVYLDIQAAEEHHLTGIPILSAAPGDVFAGAWENKEYGYKYNDVYLRKLPEGYYLLEYVGTDTKKYIAKCDADRLIIKEDDLHLILYVEDEKLIIHQNSGDQMITWSYTRSDWLLRGP